MKFEELEGWRNKREKLYLKELKGCRTNARLSWVYKATTSSRAWVYEEKKIAECCGFEENWSLKNEEDQGLILWVC